jgi:fucose 4-O-acetylase-like acetyltransferase
MSESRDITFDILKGFGVILIIGAHTLGYDNAAYPFIYVFHVPLFFMVSGFFYKHQELQKQLKKDCRRLILPYFIVTLVEVSLIVLFEYFIKHHMCVPIQLFWNSISPIWFLLALFNIRFLFNFLLCCIPHHALEGAFLISSFFLYLTHRCSILMPFAFSSAGGSLIFFAVGYYIKKYRICVKVINKSSWMVPIALLFWVNSAINGKVDTFVNEYKLWVLDYVGAISGVYLAFLVSKYVAKRCRGLASLLSKAGYYSMVIISFHSIEFIFPQWFQMLFFLPSSWVITSIFVVRLFLLSFFVWVSLRVRILRMIFII